MHLTSFLVTKKRFVYLCCLKKLLWGKAPWKNQRILVFFKWVKIDHINALWQKYIFFSKVRCLEVFFFKVRNDLKCVVTQLNEKCTIDESIWSVKNLSTFRIKLFEVKYETVNNEMGENIEEFFNIWSVCKKKKPKYF